MSLRLLPGFCLQKDISKQVLWSAILECYLRTVLLAMVHVCELFLCGVI